MGHQKSVAIIANGEIQDFSKTLEKLQNYDFLIASDGGANQCLKMGLRPDLLIGDFDSISEEALIKFSDVPKLSYPEDKDFSDLELAIEKAFSMNQEKVTLFGATGYRVDHTAANLNLLTRFPGKLYIETDREIIVALEPSISTKIKTIPGQTLSLLPIGKVLGVKTKGLKWELNNQTLDEHFFSLSNICLNEEVMISLVSGHLLSFLLF